MTPVAADIINISIQDLAFWRHLRQLIKTCKPIVDAIGNLESRDATLADCMLEFIRCARQMFRVTLDDDEDIGFWTHAKAVFNREFHAMNTPVHTLALFLHPLCRKLAVSNAAKGRTFQQICRTALDIAHKWRWPEAKARLLLKDLEQYYHCKGPFEGAQADGKAWWESLSVSQEKHPVKTLAIKLLSIVPHAAEVERLFSDLTGVQGVKRCNLTVPTFEKMGKLRANYTYHLHQRALAAGKPIRRRHAHMHTRDQPGIDTELVGDLNANFTWKAPLAASTNDDLLGPEGVTAEDIDAAFDELEKNSADATPIDPVLEGEQIEVAKYYDLEALEHIDQGLVPVAEQGDIEMLVPVSDQTGWDAGALLLAQGISTT
jgi:hypothetical protein